MLNINNKGFVDSKEIHSYIGMKSRYNDWINSGLDFIEAQEDKDFYYFFSKSTGGRPSKTTMVTIDIAKELCIINRTAKSKELRKWLISLGSKHESGLAFTSNQIESLIDLSKSMTLVSIQKQVEKKHFDLYNDKYSWYRYRAELLGYSTKDVIQAMRLVNKKHKSIRKSLIQLDANELIRAGVIDFMIALGKTQEYAENVGNLCKSMAEKMELGKLIWDDTKPNPLKLNQGSINDNKQLFNKLDR